MDSLLNSNTDTDRVASRQHKLRTRTGGTSSPMYSTRVVPGQHKDKAGDNGRCARVSHKDKDRGNRVTHVQRNDKDRLTRK